MVLLLRSTKSESKESEWSLCEQYIWRPSETHVIAYAERRSADEPFVEYLLHQDASGNVFLSTHIAQDGLLRIDDVASYWGRGENSTIVAVQKSESSLPAEQGRPMPYAIDQVLDEKSARWPCNQTGSHFLALQLEKSYHLSALTIWADKCPRTYRVYVVQANQQPRQDTLSQWEKEHSQHQVWAVRQDSADQPERRPEEPKSISLKNRPGQQIVIVWDDGANIEVRECEVFMQPRLKGDIAFSGAVVDHETGLYYHGSRYRLPELDGKFTCPNPLDFLDGNNLYAFANNHPLT